MNLIDAMRTGRPIRRGDGLSSSRLSGWICSRYMLQALEKGDMRPLSEEDFFAEDWEVREEPITITQRQFWDAWNKSEQDRFRGTPVATQSFGLLLAKNLGFKGVV